ncbi:MAG: hypothetical protein F2842_01660, partial [Actinobacteria bacterium]|nr:hypothetical protein [Actinomycetota bacterium]
AAPVIWAFVALSLPFTLLVGQSSSSGDDAPRILLGISASALIAGLLLLLRVGLRLHDAGGPSPVVAFLVYLAAGMTRAALVTGASAVSEGTFGQVQMPGEAPPLIRVVTGGMATVLVMTVVEVVTAQGARHRATVDSLRSTRERLVALAATMSERVKAAETELARETAVVLGPTMKVLLERLSDLAQSDPEQSQTAGELTRVISEVVRPLSHRLATPPEPPVVKQLPMSALSGAAALADGDVRNALRPAVLVALCELMSLVILVLGSGDARLYVISFVGTVTAWVALQLLVAVRPRSWGLGSILTDLLVLGVVYLGVFTAAHRMFSQSAALLLSGSLILLSLLLRVSLLGGLTALVFLAIRRRRLEEQLATANVELEETIAAFRRQVWLIRRRMALALHGSLQSALTSSALLLSRENWTPTDLSSARDRIELALAQLDPELQSEADLELSLTELVLLWRGTVEITATISAGAHDRLSSEVGLTTAAQEIVREAVSNSVRHGAASAVDVQVEIVEREVLRVVVTDNGRGVPDDRSRGLGSRLLDEVTIRWTLSCAGNGSVLVADLS